MPIIINELIFKGAIAGAGIDGKQPPAAGRPAVDLEALVETCVEQVLKILEQQKER
jgi:hypothetical protein